MAKKIVKHTDNSVIVNMLAFIKEIASTHNISEDEVATMLSDCIVKAYTKENFDQRLEVKVDLQKQEIEMKIPYEVVSVQKAKDYDDYNQILETDERVVKQNLKVGDTYWLPISINDLSRKVIGLVIQGFKQKISEIDYTKIANEYKDKVGTIITGWVEEYNKRNGEWVIKVADNVFGGLPKNEQNPNETIRINQKMAFYLENVKAQTRDWPLILSRKSKYLTEYYLNLVTPEIRDGDIQIRSSARIAGFKSKIAVSSAKFATNIGSPAAICVGKEGMRVKEISRYLGGEPVEIVNWYPNPLEFVLNSIGPNKVIGVCLDDLESDKRIILVVKDDAQSLIIGRHGMNIRLWSELCNYNLDIKTPSDMTELGLHYTKTNEVLARLESFFPTPEEYKTKDVVQDDQHHIMSKNLDDISASDFGLENDFMEQICQQNLEFNDHVDDDNDFSFSNEFLNSLGDDDFRDELQNGKKTK